MNFDKNRFANFAKYDLTINKAFFRNLLLVTIAGAVGIAMMGFIARYNIYHDVASNLSEWNTVPEPGEFSHYTFNYLTASYEICFFLVMMSIFAGCWAHNLRNKQGRIIELTLPATNLEKFTWHTLLMLVGGFVLCLVSMLIADGLNALLTLMMYGADNGIGSLSRSIGEIITLSITSGDMLTLPSISSGGDVSAEDVKTIYLLRAVSFAIIATALCEIVTFFFGNALKYKYNIILTYIALQVLSAVGSICFFIITAVTTGEAIDAIADSDMDNNDVINLLTGLSVAGGVLSLLVAAGLIWWSYRRYTKAQISAPFNK
ncbi:MAG: hypothetical protein IJP75_04430 [Bacteroidaceae bacterium]|nr:hypothetical protein [Bacteroidaceae bacterium]